MLKRFLSTPAGVSVIISCFTPARRMAMGLWPWICATMPTGHSIPSARVPSDWGSPYSVMCGSPASFTAARVCMGFDSPMRPVSEQVLDATAAETPAQRTQSLLREAAVPGLGRPEVPDTAAFVQPDAQCSFFEEAVPERFLRRISGADSAIADLV